MQINFLLLMSSNFAKPMMALFSLYQLFFAISLLIYKWLVDLAHQRRFEIYKFLNIMEKLAVLKFHVSRLFHPHLATVCIWFGEKRRVIWLILGLAVRQQMDMILLENWREKDQTVSSTFSMLY